MSVAVKTGISLPAYAHDIADVDVPRGLGADAHGDADYFVPDDDGIVGWALSRLERREQAER